MTTDLVIAIIIVITLVAMMAVFIYGVCMKETEEQRLWDARKRYDKEERERRRLKEMPPLPDTPPPPLHVQQPIQAEQ